MGALMNSVLDPATSGPGTGGWMSTHQPTAPDWLVVPFWHLPACSALQDYLGVEVACPTRVEKDPQGCLYLAAEVCQLRTPSGPAVLVVPPGLHAPSSTAELRLLVGRALPLCVWPASAGSGIPTTYDSSQLMQHS